MPYLSYVPDREDAPDFEVCPLLSASLDGDAALLYYDVSGYDFAATDAAGRLTTKRSNRWNFAWRVAIPNGCPIEYLRAAVTFGSGVPDFVSLIQQFADGTVSSFDYQWMCGLPNICGQKPLAALVRVELFDTGVRDDIVDGTIPSFFTIQSSNYELF